MSTGTSLRFLFAGGGTGGHLFPAVAIAEALSLRLSDRFNLEIAFVGTERGIEYRQRETLGYPLHLLPVRGLTRAFTLKNLLVPFLYLVSLWKARKLVRDFSPSMVVGTGGYVSLPVLKAAQQQRIPTVLQEQNSFPGIATRRAAGGAKRIYLGFEDARSHLSQSVQTIVTGNPVRATIGTVSKSDARASLGIDSSKHVILVIGGSQGARAINQAVIKSVQGNALFGQYQLLWQTGTRDYTEVVRQLGDRIGTNSVFPFDTRMHLLYAAADIAIARAGAITLAELEASKLPSILIPYPHAAGDHQRHNATAFVSMGYARVIDELQLATTDILSEARQLLESGEATRMRQALTSSANHKPAAEQIVDDIMQLLQISPRSGGTA